MHKKLFYILTTYFLVASFITVAQDQFVKTPSVKNYSTRKLGGAINYMGNVMPDNSLMFANEYGVLTFDGTNWELIDINNGQEIVSLLYKDSLIYVGGDNEFGYLKPLKNGKYNYTSFKSNYSRLDTLDRFFQIVPIDNDIYFQNYGIIFRWDGSELHEIMLDDAYIFNVNNMLIASVFDQGLALVKNDSVEILTSSFKFEDDAAYNIYPTNNDCCLKIFTSEKGIFKYNIANNTATSVKNEASELFKKDGFYYVAPFLDSLWVATTSNGGVTIFNDDGKILRFIDNSDGITGKYLRELFIDHRNKIWVTSDVGISEVYWPQFDTLTKAKTKLNDFSVDRNSFSMNKPDSALREDARIQFKFSTPGFNDDEVLYSHKLEGGNGTWSEWEPYSIREYTQLKGGHYRFSVKSKTVTGIETEPISIEFEVKTPWFKSIAAYFLYTLAVVLIIALYIWARTLKLNITNKRLEFIVNKRTKELVEKTEALEASNEELKIKNHELDQFVYRSSHDLIAPLKSLKGLIYIAKSDSTNTKQEEYLSYMERSVLKLEDFINSIIDFTTNVNTPQVVEAISINDIIEDLKLELKYFGQTDDIEIIKKIEIEHLQCDPKRLRIILSNLITNCVKYHNYNQPNPIIEIRSFVKNNQVIIEVEDNGQGIKPELLNNIFDMFFRASDTAEGSGLGLYIVKDTVAKIGGVINVSSVYGKGTIFTIIIANEE